MFYFLSSSTFHTLYWASSLLSSGNYPFGGILFHSLVTLFLRHCWIQIFQGLKRQDHFSTFQQVLALIYCFESSDAILQLNRRLKQQILKQFIKIIIKPTMSTLQNIFFPKLFHSVPGYTIMSTLLDQTATKSRQRWYFLIFFYSYLQYRIIRYDYLALMYFMGLYVIYMIVLYFTPSGLPDPDEDSFENSLFVEESQDIMFSTQGDRPVLRAITQFELWKTLMAVSLGSLVCTWFQMFLIPIYWPFLLVYFVLLIGRALMKHLQHMKKYGYSLSDFKTKKLMNF